MPVPRLRLALLAATLILPLAAPGSVRAAVELGSVPTSAPPATCGTSPSTYFQVSTENPGIAPYAAPSNGVIVKFRSAFAGTAGTPIKWRLWRRSGGNIKSIAVVSSTVAADGTAQAPARIAAQTGDILGVGGPGGAGTTLNCAFMAASANTIGGGPTDAAADVETPFTAMGGTGIRLNVIATLEPDADGDGWGDETQDACPADATRHVSCETDLQLDAATAVPEIPVGGVNVLTFTVRAPAGGSASDVRADVTLPGGLTLLAVYPGAGSCSDLACSLGSVGAGQSVPIIVIVKATEAGSKSASATVRSATADPSGTNNTASATFAVTAPAAAAPPPVATPVAAKLCTVPKLRGLTRAAAAKALTGAGCKLGKVRLAGGKLKRKVSAQTVPAGIRVAQGTAIGVTLRGKRPRRA